MQTFLYLIGLCNRSVWREENVPAAKQQILFPKKLSKFTLFFQDNPNPNLGIQRRGISELGGYQ